MIDRARLAWPAAAAFVLFCTTTRAEGTFEAPEPPHWIWLDDTSDHQEVVFQRRFELAAAPTRAIVSGSCDNHMVVLVNGERVGSHGRWEVVASSDVAKALKPGENTLEVRARNDGGPAGLALRLVVDDTLTLATDASWKAALPQRAMRGRWNEATVLGRVGDPDLPWSGTITAKSFEAPGVIMAHGDPNAPQKAQAADGIHLLDGFEAELLYTVPGESQGSWVALTKDDRGRLYTSDQGKRGLYRITPAELGDADSVTSVERVPVEVSGAQGMCWAFDSLYVNVNGQGLWRIRDTDGDDVLDDAVNLIPLGYGGEHGPHAVLPTPDGEGLYFIAGNHTRPPAFDGSQAPANWDEDLLLPRLWDANGHARGMLAPGGWIARCDPDGENVQILSTGYRNQFDIALHVTGEMFTYDADMEWDVGTPWYRPTRICHVTSGSEFGWRSGTGKWPPYYEDSLPPVLEIGPGSPTGLLFGYRANFPERYQNALFALDWTFGTIYAIHLESKGSSFVATKEDFAWAKPLGVTDAVIADDGAMYFTVGGRGSQSALYRIRYTGEDSVEPAPVRLPMASELARANRQDLERFHGRVDPSAVDEVWESLGSPDRFIRYAARIAVENQPVETWRARALAEDDPTTSTSALIALARQGTPSDLPALVDALGRIDLATLDVPQQLARLRAYALAFARLGAPDDERRARTAAVLDASFPADSDDVNNELTRVLTFLGAPSVVPKTMALMRADSPVELPPWAELIQRNDTYGGPIAKMLADPPPVRDIERALMLRNAREGWNDDLRREYFEFFVEASKHPGGNSYAGFLENIRDDAADTLSVTEARRFADLIGRPLVTALPENIEPPEGPGRTWTVADARAAVGDKLVGRSYDRGRNLFHAAKCSTCHRFDGEGGAIGPDLTTVANKFSVADILESIVDPNRVISDQYGSHMIVDTDGEIEEGILVEGEDEVLLYSRDPDEEPLVYDRDEIKLIKESPTSQMPGGLVDAFSAEELKDLVAFLVSGGDRKASVFASSDRDR